MRTVPLLVGKALPADNTIYSLDCTSFEKPQPMDVANLRRAFGAVLRHPEELAEKVNSYILTLSLDGLPYSLGYIWGIAQVFNRALLCGIARAGILIERVQMMLTLHDNQQKEELQRFSMAADIVGNPELYKDLVALNKNDMNDSTLGFAITDKTNTYCIAFELNQDFSRFLTSRLGLRTSDSERFRRYLRNRGLIQSMSRNERGRSGAPVSYVLIIT